jgi:hypothetical protein
MKAIINRVFSRKEEPAPASPPPSVLSSELSHGDIENYYLRMVSECLGRMLVPADSVEVKVRRAGVGPTGLSAFAAYVRITRWDPVLTPVLLQNLPVLDARVRKLARASLILEHTHFAGLWFQATASTEGAPRALVGIAAELIRQPAGPAAAP